MKPTPKYDALRAMTTARYGKSTASAPKPSIAKLRQDIAAVPVKRRKKTKQESKI